MIHYQAVIELVPVAVLVSVASMAWRGSRKFTIIELLLARAVENTEKCDKALGKLGQRVALMEGQLKMMNGKSR